MGSLIMPHNIYLHSALVLSRKEYMATQTRKKEAVVYFGIESAFSLTASVGGYKGQRSFHAAWGYRKFVGGAAVGAWKGATDTLLDAQKGGGGSLRHRVSVLARHAQGRRRCK